MKNLLKTAFYKILKKCQENKFLNTIIQFMYLNVLSKFYGKPQVNVNFNNKKIRIAFICDEMTWCDFNDYCNAVFLHPKIWHKQIEIFKPEILFCESAWRGIDKYKSCWRGRIYKNKKILFENRKELISILDYCKKQGIITIFWNKEDPIYFNHLVYDFTDTALLFDYIFTTAKECIDLYKAYGHKNVYLLPFGVNTKMFYPQKNNQKKKTVLFAGSWYAEHNDRCIALERMFDYVLDNGMYLDIYDRQFNSSEEKFKFPQKYNKYIKPPVPFSEIPDLTRKYSMCINVNTVSNSETMFSRRILQLLACGVKVLTNYSKSMDSFFEEDIKITKIDNYMVEIFCDFNVIQKKHSSLRRLNFILNTIGKKNNFTRGV